MLPAPRPPTWLIVAGVLLVVLFVVGIGMGAAQGNGGDAGDLDSGTLKALEQRIVHKEHLKLDDLRPRQPGCVQQEFIVVPLNASCVFDIAAGDRSGRRGKLRLKAGNRVVLTLAQGNLTSQQTITPAAPTATFDVNDEDVVLALSCVDAGQAAQCVLALE